MHSPMSPLISPAWGEDECEWAWSFVRRSGESTSVSESVLWNLLLMGVALSSVFSGELAKTFPSLSLFFPPSFFGGWEASPSLGFSAELPVWLGGIDSLV